MEAILNDKLCEATHKFIQDNINSKALSEETRQLWIQYCQNLNVSNV